MKSNEIRKIWIDFWKEKEHEIIKSASLIPKDDNSLLWINAGVAPLKKYFDGSSVPQNKRMANIQKCLRTNDIENVGMTSHHHTFFEMLGNFSIGDYFKKEAVEWAYELVFSEKWFNIPKEKVYITVYDKDEETYNLWLNLGIEESHLIKMETNFWEIGSGPCGPDTELFFDRGEEFDKEKKGIKLISEDIDNDRYVEFWNIVFSQYNSKDELERNQYPELPHKNIDTGMGLERMTALLSSKVSNFETDLFVPIIEKIEMLTETKNNGKLSYKVIADHIRTLVFTINDGAVFSNNKRGYVIRRLLRRSVVHLKKLSEKEISLVDLVDTVIDLMKDAYPELENNKEFIKNSIKNEEKLFKKTLISGEKKLLEIFENSSDKKINGEDAFRMYDTFGYPIELLKEEALTKGFEVDMEGFNLFMEEQKTRAREAASNEGFLNEQNEELLEYKKESLFVGYDTLTCEAKIEAIFDGEKFVNEIKGEAFLLFDKTPFYAESGGQVSDKGIIYNDDYNLEVIDIKKAPNGQFLHYINSELIIKKGDSVTLQVSENYRKNIAVNHSLIHLTQLVLKKYFDDLISQAGSKAYDKRGRFDFKSSREFSIEDIILIEEKLNELIKTDKEIYTEVLPIEEAKKKEAIAIFDEKYDKDVRVVTIGDSVEFCGGTHIKEFTEINKVAVVSLESKGSNIYRIEVTANDNIEIELKKEISPYNQEMLKLLEKAKEIYSKAKKNNIDLSFDYEIDNSTPKSYKDIIFNKNEMNGLRKKIKTFENLYEEKLTEKTLKDLSVFENNIKEKDSNKYLIMKVENYSGKILKQIVDELFNQIQKGIIIIANVSGNNVNYVAKNNIENVNVGALVKELSEKSSGNGGGSPLFAQGGGSNALKVDELLNNLENDLLN